MLDPAYNPPPRQLVPGSLPAAGTEPATDAEGIHWACQRCTHCCRWPGEVRLLPEEPAKIAAYLGLSEDDFANQHTQLRADRKGLRLNNLPDGTCSMLEGNSCRIQAAKPHQCGGFPNTWRFPGWREVCEAIPLKKDPATSHWTRAEL
jgi:Fe-S-cluster containining protein